MKGEPMTNHYVTLGVRPDAEADVIKRAYRACVRHSHPDVAGDSATFRAIQAAYDVLRDGERRAQYDRARRTWMAQVGAVECRSCGHANRITRRPRDGERVRCWHCKATLSLLDADLRTAQRQSLAHESARFVEEVGVELADLAADAVRAGISRLRSRLGLLHEPRRRGG